VLTDKVIIGLFFIFSCLFGFSLAIYPGWIKRRMKTKSQNNANNKQKNFRNRLGHHPDCSKFNSHTLKTKNKVYCAGCLGLALGCIISIILVIIYIPISFEYSSDLFQYLILFGFIIIGIVYIEILVNNQNIFIHILSNSLLIISFLIIIISITELTRNISFGIICIVLSFLWIDTRIQLSKLHHSIICKKCDNSCKMY
jgi:uncharacterized membrane protein